MIFASLARAHERVLDGEINSPFLLNEHGDLRNFFQVFSKDSLIKNICEEEKKFDSGTGFFFGK